MLIYTCFQLDGLQCGLKVVPDTNQGFENEESLNNIASMIKTLLDE